jgi:hypothetical protein
MEQEREISLKIDQIWSGYKETAFRAAESTQAEESLSEQSEYVYE